MSFDQSKRSLSTCLCDSQPKLGGLFLIYIFMINDSVYLYISYIYIYHICVCMISKMTDRSTPLQCVSALLCRWYMQRHFDLACFSAPCRLGRRWTANPMKHRHRMLAMLDTWYIYTYNILYIYIVCIYIYIIHAIFMQYKTACCSSLEDEHL